MYCRLFVWVEHREEQKYYYHYAIVKSEIHGSREVWKRIWHSTFGVGQYFDIISVQWNHHHTILRVSQSWRYALSTTSTTQTQNNTKNVSVSLLIFTTLFSSESLERTALAFWDICWFTFLMRRWEVQFCSHVSMLSMTLQPADSWLA